MSDDIAISVNNVSKTFKLPYEKHSTLKGVIVNFHRNKKGYKKQVALKDISFEIKKGEFFGIVGRNGSGKSTLLKLISGIYTPDSGTIQVNGKLTPFIELGVGFNPELTGKDNVYLNGALLGFNHKEVEAMYDEIVAFAELEKFMEQKLKNYSSGMQVRLAFSIAIRANTDILVLDEVLAVGDEAFQRKCFEYFGKLKKSNKTVVLVTHDMNAVQRFCNRAMIIHESEVMKIGKVKEIANEYTAINLEDVSPVKEIKTDKDLSKNKLSKEQKIEKYGTGEADISFSIKSSSNRTKKAFSPAEKIVIEAKVLAKEKLIEPRIGMVIQNSFGNILFATNTLIEDIPVEDLNKGDKLKVEFITNNIFTDGTYSISGAIASNYDERLYCRVEDVCSFVSGGWSMKHALVHPKHEIIVKKQ